ncbi:Dbl homology domain-containing protein [Flammula alnicola]|nr:Dbl homology domain-containing protein [Flammula alnicola]
MSRKLSRDYSQPSHFANSSNNTADDNGAGGSGNQQQQNPEEEVPTSPSTEFPDPFSAFLPGYIEKAHEDPNAPQVDDNADDDYTAPPPESYEESVISDERYRSGKTTLTLGKGGDYPMLRPPSNSSEFRGTGTILSLRRPGSNIVEVTVNPARVNTVDSYDVGDHDDWVAGPSDLSRRNTNVIQQIVNFDQRTQLELHEEEEEDFYDDDERRFINPSLLSHLSVQLRDLIPRGTHVKGSIPYPRAFTGKDIVSTLHSIIQRGIARDLGTQHPTDRRAALLVARSLQTMLFFYEVEWGARVLQDGVEDVYMFMDDQKLPTGVGMQQLPSITESPVGATREEWSKKVPAEVLASLTDNEINRQTIIHKLISKEEQYIEDLNIVESVFIKPTQSSQPSNFIEEVFGNILELLECNRRLLEVMYVRQREQHPVIQNVGDIFLDAATEFRDVYPIYVGHHPLAEKRMKEELEHNPEFRLFIEKCSRQLAARPGESPRLDLKHYLNRPAEHLQKYPVLLEAVYRETEESNPDGDYLQEAIAVIQNLQNVAQLRTFQSAMGKGSTGKWEWHDLVSPEMLSFELIKGEMAYVRDLENIETMYVRPLRNAEPPIIPPNRLNQFLMDVFHNFNELHAHHRRLVDNLHEIQREEHPSIRTITAVVFDAALNFREAYMEYIPNYPIAAYRIDEEMANNPAFKAFVNHTVRHPDAHRLDMKNFINRPIPRLLRYELLLKEILSETPGYHEDRDTIPQVIDVIKALGRETEPGVQSSKQKVELWKYNSNLVFKAGEQWYDMDLLNEQRSLIHTGRLFRQPDNGIDELFVMLFDNYLVMTHPRERDGITKYHVYRRPIPLDLLTLVNFTDAAVRKSTSLIRSLWGNGDDRQADVASISSRSLENGDTRALYPFTIHHNGRLGASGSYVIYAESTVSRLEWKQKLEESKGLRKVVQESTNVDTFLLPTLTTGPNSSVWQDGTLFTGKVTCSVPFNTPDGRGLVAIGCAEGVWIGYRHDSRCNLHLKMVTQCAILEDLIIDTYLTSPSQVLFAYHLEALVPTTPGSIHASQTPQRINGKDEFVCFFCRRMRSLLMDLSSKNNDSVFHAIEPVIDKINERPKASGGLIPSLKRNKTEWFRNYKDFSFPDAYDLIFLKTRITVLCTKGFMIMDLINYKSVNIPQRDDPNFPYITKRCDACRPLGIFRSGEDEFLLCYDEIGLFVDKQGHPSRKTGTIEWEGTAERVALHSPYVLLFDTRFIEVRHLETGRLRNRCIWDGRSLDGGAAVVPAEGTEERMVQEPRVHAMFSNFPTIPLYLPGSLSSPTTAPYFPVSFSPPRSPPLRRIIYRQYFNCTFRQSHLST